MVLASQHAGAVRSKLLARGPGALSVGDLEHCEYLVAPCVTPANFGDGGRIVILHRSHHCDRVEEIVDAAAVELHVPLYPVDEGGNPLW
jgi:hypothetical protein